MYQAIQRSTIWTVTNLMTDNRTVHYSFTYVKVVVYPSYNDFLSEISSQRSRH